MQKDNQLSEMNQMHEQELFKLAAKSDASADLDQVLVGIQNVLIHYVVVFQTINQVTTLNQ